MLVHLAFIIVGGREETRSINLEGSRNVFEAARGVDRLVYTSSVAAYGFHADNPQPLTEDVPVRGTDAHYYSAQKAELEQTLREALDGADTETYVFRPCIVAGGDALALIEAFPALRAQGAGRPGAAQPRHAVPARAHRRRGARARRRRARRGRARRLQPRRRRHDHRRRPRARVRLALRAGPEGGRRADRGRRRPAAADAAAGVVAERVPRAGRDGHRARPRASSAGTRATTRRPCSPTWPRSARDAGLL